MIVPVLNEAANLGAVLDALAGQSDAGPFEVLVVDNGSTDGTPELAAAHPLGPRVLREPTRGPYAARNAGIAAARGEVLAFTDADCRPAPDWLARGREAIDGGADLVGGAIIQECLSGASVWARYDAATYLRQERYVRDQGFAATANLFVRRAMFEAVGPFRPELVASGDVELCQRAVAAGHRLQYSAAARVGHQPRRTMRETWALHRKLGSGFAELATAGLRGSAWEDPALRESFAEAVVLVAEDGGYLRRRRLLPVHATVLAARWVGRLTGRG